MKSAAVEESVSFTESLEVVKVQSLDGATHVVAAMEKGFYSASNLDQVQLAKANLDLTEQLKNIGNRQSYGKLMFGLTVGWLILSLATVWATSIKITSPSWWPAWLPLVTEFNTSDGVLLALLGTTTVNVIGLLVIVLKNLFPDMGKQK